MGSGSLSNSQFSPGIAMVFENPTGMLIQKFESLPPASSSNTFTAGSSVSRFASTQPAEPAPTTI